MQKKFHEGFFQAVALHIYREARISYGTTKQAKGTPRTPEKHTGQTGNTSSKAKTVRRPKRPPRGRPSHVHTFAALQTQNFNKKSV